MASSLRQIVAFDPTPAKDANIAGATSHWPTCFPLPTLSGSTIAILGTISNFVGTTVASCSDSVNGAYTSLDHVTDSGNADFRTFYFPNAAVLGAGSAGTATGGSTTTLVDSSKTWTTNQWAGKTFVNVTTLATATVTSNTATTLTFPAVAASASGNVYTVGGHVDVALSAFDDYNASWLVEVTGVTATPIAGHAAKMNTITGAGTDTVTSGTAACGSSPVLVVGFAANDGGTTGTFVPNAGTGFTSGGTSWAWDLGQVSSRIESKNVSNPGTIAATFSPSGADTYFAAMIAFTDSSSSGAALAGTASDAVTAAGALSTSIKLGGTPSDATSATGVLTTAIRPAGSATDVTSATGTLAGAAAALAGAASDVVTAAGALFTSIRLASGATDSTSATGGLTTGILLGSAASDTTSATAFLTNWASVTLTSPLYTGFGGVLDPAIPWTRPPVVGSTLYYDATYITIATNGVFSSTANNISALVQFNDGSGWQDRIITITPYLVGYASTLTSATGSLSSATQLAGAATDLTSAAASLSTQIKMAGSASDAVSATGALTAAAGLNGAASDLTSAVGALTTAIRLASTAIDTTIASATLNGTAAPLAGSASDSISATGVLSTQIRLAAAAVDAITAFGALSTHIVLAATALDAISATGSLSRVAALAGTANDTTSASALLTTRIALLGAAGDTISAAGNLVTHIMMIGAATDTTSATGDIFITAPVQFGRATVVALSQTGFQAARTAYLEGSACFILAGYFGPSRAPFTPQAVQYRMDDVTSGLNLVPWTSITPAATNQVAISSTLNEMVSLTRPWECRQVVFQITDWFGDTNYARVVYDLIRVPGEMSS